jgi:hypothetical protein
VHTEIDDEIKSVMPFAVAALITGAAGLSAEFAWKEQRTTASEVGLAWSLGAEPRDRAGVCRRVT